jgi:hypothetical protein
VGKDRVVRRLSPPVSLWKREMLEGGHPIGPGVSDRFKVRSTAQLAGAIALGHPARHLRDVTKLGSSDQGAVLDAQGSEFAGGLLTSRRVQRCSCQRIPDDFPNQITWPCAHDRPLRQMSGARRSWIAHIPADRKGRTIPCAGFDTPADNVDAPAGEADIARMASEVGASKVRGPSSAVGEGSGGVRLEEGPRIEVLDPVPRPNVVLSGALAKTYGEQAVAVKTCRLAPAREKILGRFVDAERGGRGLGASRKGWRLQGHRETGATGLEPATSGVTVPPI